MKASYTEEGGNDCVEVPVQPDGVGIRDSFIPH
ncbi:DUF397 domain-containing protein [Streptantibioticus ferralitis]